MVKILTMHCNDHATMHVTLTDTPKTMFTNVGA